MDQKFYCLLTCLQLLRLVSVSRACYCQPNLKEEACNSDYVIVAKVLEERQLESQKGQVFHYSLNIVDVIKTSESYERAEHLLQMKLNLNGCFGQLRTGHTYIFAGTVGDFVDEGKTRTFLETEYCKYIDFKSNNVEELNEAVEMLKNPPACIQSRGTRFNSPFHKKARWNNPFQK